VYDNVPQRLINTVKAILPEFQSSVVNAAPMGITFKHPISSIRIEFN